MGAIGFPGLAAGRMPTNLRSSCVIGVPITPLEEISMKNLLSRLGSDESGQDLVEYALLISLVAIATVASMQKLASAISDVFSTAAGNLTAS
jgi:pilus assembly protein Flp/PilA